MFRFGQGSVVSITPRTPALLVTRGDYPSTSSVKRVSHVPEIVFKVHLIGDALGIPQIGDYPKSMNTILISLETDRVYYVAFEDVCDIGSRVLQDFCWGARDSLYEAGFHSVGKEVEDLEKHLAQNREIVSAHAFGWSFGEKMTNYLDG